MYDAPGVGLAAPQVGLPLQLAVIEDREEYSQGSRGRAYVSSRTRTPPPFHFHVIINPKFTAMGGDQAEFFEGCLSVSGFSAVVPRARTVRVECLNERAEAISIDASGWYARIIQHEIDHLNGGLYIDRMLSRTFTTLENWAEFCKGKPISDIKEGVAGLTGHV